MAVVPSFYKWQFVLIMISGVFETKASIILKNAIIFTQGACWILSIAEDHTGGYLSRGNPQSNRLNFKSLCKFLLAHSDLACHCESVLSLPFKCGKTHTTVSQSHLKVIIPIQRCVIPCKCGKIHKASTVTMKIIGNKESWHFHHCCNANV